MLMVAGEASGDLHGANLVNSMRALHPGVRFQGIGGERMRAAGVRIHLPAAELAVVGLTEALSRLFVAQRAAGEIKRRLRDHPPDLLILIDFPEFNLHIARTAKRRGVPVLYYISPQIWAWRRGRVRKIARRVDRMAVILPFEEPFYRAHGVRVDYVGHPLLDTCPLGLQRETARRSLGMQDGAPVVALLPGSRTEEIERLLPPMLGAFRFLQRQYPGAHALLPLAHTLNPPAVTDLVRPWGLPVEVVRGRVYEVLKASDVALVTSGTATLETALMGIPMVVAYKVSSLTYRAGRLLIKVPYISLVNLVAGREVVRECIQDQANAERLAAEALHLLGEPGARDAMRRDLAEVRTRLGDGGASQRTAEVALAMIAGFRGSRAPS